MVLVVGNHVCDNRRMDWKELINFLLDNGHTQAQIAKRCGTGQSYISSLLSGSRKSPNWGLGNALIEFRDEVRASLQEREAA